MSFAEKLKNIRKQYGMSQEQLAEKIGVSRQAITKWETDGGMPDIENLLSIASLFNTIVDDLLSGEKSTRASTDFFHESVTGYDIDGKKHFDINVGGAYLLKLSSSASEKILVRLASNVISTLESSFKVKIDDNKNHIDVDIRRTGNVTETQTREALFVFISLPEKYFGGAEIAASVNTLRLQNLSSETERIEFEGKATEVYMNQVKAHVELDSSSDMSIVCDSLCGGIDVNQIKAVSTIHVPKGTLHYDKVKGKSNSIVYMLDSNPAASSSNKDAENVIELAGMNAELVINEYTLPPKEVHLK